MKNFPMGWFVSLVESSEKWMSKNLRLGAFFTIEESGLMFSQNRTWSRQSVSINFISTSFSYIDLFSKFVMDRPWTSSMPYIHNKAHQLICKYMEYNGFRTTNILY